MPTPRDAPYKLQQRTLRRLARIARKRGPTFMVPGPSHRGSLGVR